ncbi:hypothetical protein MSAN_02043600 [Mycena sanguinolenta]|uniref:Uncharacterized protein n=1 Tax=Mycena sanguinolenta TaxID=230812 RepID=A0A8H6XI03_9AGAR|nr:hypothetical protein MSAN_02043600 [Mycena sanguinolenta]
MSRFELMSSSIYIFITDSTSSRLSIIMAAGPSASIVLATSRLIPDEPAFQNAERDALTARAATDALVKPIVTRLLEYHDQPVPPDELAHLINAFHEQQFVALPDFADARDYSHRLLLALRHEWRRYHCRPNESKTAQFQRGDGVLRVQSASTFGEAARILEGEYQVDDNIFWVMRNVWRGAHGRGYIPDSVPGLCDSFKSLILHP